MDIKPDGTYIDGTVGAGGHSKEILKNLSSNGKLICFDKDPDAIKYTREIFPNNSIVTIIQSDFRFISKELDNLKIEKVDGILLDLGVSSYQIDQVRRGFSYSKEAPLDMRMSNEGLSAYDIVNTYEAADIADILFKYGEERFSWNIANNIIKYRNIKPIETTVELCNIIQQSIPAKVRKKGGNPFKRTFQAIRIAVNNELDSLSYFIKNSFKRLNLGGRFSIITFHSLEDRIVKQSFKSLSKSCICPSNFPICVCDNKPLAKLINKKPIIPSYDELLLNSRSSSAKLRTIEKL